MQRLRPKKTLPTGKLLRRQWNYDAFTYLNKRYIDYDNSQNRCIIGSRFFGMKIVGALLIFVLGVVGIAYIYAAMSKDAKFGAHVTYCFGPGYSSKTPSAYKFWKTGYVEPVDRFLCMVTGFFSRSAEHPVGELFGHWFATTCLLSSWAIVSVESLRSGTRAVAKWPSVTLLLGILAGISLTVPSLFIPSLLLSDRASHTVKKGKVKAAGLTTLLVGAALQLGRHATAPWFGQYMFLFNLVLPLISALWVLFPAGSDSNTSFKSFYTFFAGVCAINHLAFVSELVFLSTFKPVEFIVFLKSVAENPGLNAPLFFLIFDMLVLWVAFLVYVLFDGGFVATLRYVFETLLVGPGASLMLFEARRGNNVSTEVKRKTQ